MQVEWWYLVVSTAALGAGCDRFPGQLGSVRAEAEANRRAGNAARSQIRQCPARQPSETFCRSAFGSAEPAVPSGVGEFAFFVGQVGGGPDEGGGGFGPGEEVGLATLHVYLRGLHHLAKGRDERLAKRGVSP